MKSLHGNWREERLFTLRQSLELYRTYVKQIATADQKIESLLSEFVPRVDPGQKPLPADGKKNRSGAKRRKKAGISTGFDLRSEAYKLFGVDVTQIPGLESNALPLFSEVGRDMTFWPDADHFVSWLALCPDNDIRPSVVARHAQGQQPRRSDLPHGRPVLASKSDSHGRLSSTPQGQTRPGRSHYRYRQKDRDSVLYPRQQAGRIRSLTLDPSG